MPTENFSSPQPSPLQGRGKGEGCVPVAVVIIAKNEEKRIEECIRSVAWAREVVVIDDESQDRTSELCRQLGAKVFKRAMDIEGRQRNFGFEQATQPWILSLDADERVTPELAKEIGEALSRHSQDESVVGFAIPILTYIGERQVRGAGYYPARKARMFRKGRFRYEEARVHPRALYEGKIVELNGDILHYSCNNLGEFINKFNRETTLEAEKWLLDKRKVTLANALRKTADRFLKNYFLKKGWKDGVMGLVMSSFHGLYQFFSYAKYWEMKQSRVVFIDRDGVINVDPIDDYVKSWEEFRFHEGVLEGLKRLTTAGYQIILISNQAGVGDNVYPEKDLWDIHHKMLGAFQEKGIQVHASYFCLHGKKAGCKCRKPQTGLFLEASKNGLKFDRSRTYFVGDKVTDIEAGKNFGLRTILVRMGHGQKDEPMCKGALAPDAIVNNFQEAVERVLCA
ncbi:MAG: HAD-IIIA family hydrolase [Candidatus Omnitrophica bacterium]|nr:HAD-IIIA family hydrolase [Candidatus Omnitrophota bacterium]